MNSQRAVLTTLGCAGSLAAMLAMASPAAANPIQAGISANADDSLPTLAQSKSNPITDSLGCSCARCTMGDARPSL